MAFVGRYVKIDSSHVQIKEPSLNFFPLYGKSAKEITKFILSELQENGFDVMLRKGQAFDNASTMTGIHFGVQRRIKAINSQAFYLSHVEITCRYACSGIVELS